MKLLLTICLLGYLSLTVSCEKRWFDYRNKYTGDYHFTYKYSKWDQNIGFYETGTIEFDGEIYYSKKDDAKNILHLHFTETETLDIKVEKNGLISATCDVIIGKFTDKNTFQLTTSTAQCGSVGGMGQKTNYELIGIN
jgi:hypothetical protein